MFPPICSEVAKHAGHCVRTRRGATSPSSIGWDGFSGWPPLSGAAPAAGSQTRWEWLLAAAVVLAGFCAGLFLWRVGYLPQPFFYDVHAPQMHLYDTAYWANRPGAYGPGKNIYPPLSFVLLRLTSIQSCYTANPILSRSCDWLSGWVLIAFFLANIVVVGLVYRNTAPASFFPRAIALCLGLPMLYALQRGNVIIIAFTFFVLGYGDLIRGPPPRSHALRWLAVALSINFKPYLLIAIIPAIIRRRWRWVAGCLAACTGVYGLSWALEGSGSPIELLRNLRNYAVFVDRQHWADLYYATSYLPLVHALPTQFQLLGLTSPHAADGLALLALALMRTAQLGVALTIVVALRRPANVNASRFTAMILAMVLTTIATGQSGYVQIFLFFLVFREPWRGPMRIAILALAYLLCIPADYVLLPVIHGPAHSWLGRRDVVVIFGVSVGQVARPAMLLAIQFGLIALNLADSFRRDAGASGAGPAAKAASQSPRLSPLAQSC